MSVRFDGLLLSRPFLGGLFPCACTLFTLEDTVYIIRTGKYGSVVQFGGFLQSSVTNERLGNEARINPRRHRNLSR